ncbi:hypothetical protein [Rosettibacter primus]|uniref:hypothetical protein n=1 Tax=Rosettibacter primus TaxID=3111523 RepID=UPI00336BF4B8
MIKGFNAGVTLEEVNKLFFLYPPILVVSIISNIALGELLLGVLWWVVLISEVGIVFLFYLYTLRHSFEYGFKKNGLSSKLFPFNYKTNKKEKLFIRLLNLFPQSNAFIVKDVFCIIRNPRIQLWFLLSCVCVWFVSISQIDTFFRHVIMISTPIIILLPLASNLFAFDASGLLLYFIAPISLCSSIFQKNVAISIVGIVYTIPIIIWTLIINSVNIIIILISIPILLYQLCVINIFGTIISMWFTYKVNYKSIVGQFNPMVSQPYILFAFAFSEGLLALVILLFYENKFILLSVTILLAIVSVIVYKSLHVKFFKRLFIKRKEYLIKQLVKSEIKTYE